MRFGEGEPERAFSQPFLVPMVPTVSPRDSGPPMSPVIPSPLHLFRRISGCCGDSGYEKKVSRDNTKTAQHKDKMSTSASEGLEPAYGDLFVEHGAPPGPGSHSGGGVITGVALPASEARDAATLSL